MSVNIYQNPYISQIISLAIPNKYTKWYCDIINRALLRASTRSDAKLLLGNTEGHHILPKCFKLGGEKDKSNLAFLSLKEHFIVHHLLCKIFSDNKKNLMWYAMTQFTRKSRPLNARQISIAMSYKHKPCDADRANAISISRKLTNKIICNHCNKETDPGNYKRFHGDNCKFGPTADQVKSDRTARAQQSMTTGKLNGTFQDVKTRVESKGKSIHAHNHIERTCPHCNKIGKGPVMLQKHFGNCPKQNSQEYFSYNGS